MAASKNITVKVTYGDLVVELTAEGASWNPDVANDLIARTKILWRETVETMIETDAWKMIDADDDE
jgi:hypothetical protein